MKFLIIDLIFLFDIVWNWNILGYLLGVGIVVVGLILKLCLVVRLLVFWVVIYFIDVKYLLNLFVKVIGLLGTLG